MLNTMTRAPYIQGDPATRFWPKVDKTDGCWLWTAATNEFGYGIFRIDGRNVRAHRWAYEDLVGPIPKGLVLDHLCRTPACVRPDHLEPVTQKVNSERGAPGGRVWRSLKTHCPAGHPYEGDNLYVYDGKRFCKACRAEAWARWRSRQE
jgi:hypothetical protein